MSSKTICIYPPNDDGFTCAWMISKFLSNAQYVPLQPTSPLPEPIFDDAKNTDLVLLKHLFTIPTMRRLVDSFRSVLVVHHHRMPSNLGELSPVLLNDNEIPSDVSTLVEHFEKPAFRVYNDGNFSASMCLHHFLYPKQAAPVWLSLIDDQVMARNHPDLKMFTAGLRSKKQTFENWDALDVTELIAVGKVELEQFTHQLAAITQKSEKALLDGYLCVFAEAPNPTYCNDYSEWAFGTDKSAQLAATYSKNSTDWSCSVRSRGDIDVGELCKKFGGGGTKTSGGFAFEVKEDVFKPLY